MGGILWRNRWLSFMGGSDAAKQKEREEMFADMITDRSDLGPIIKGVGSVGDVVPSNLPRLLRKNSLSDLTDSTSIVNDGVFIK